MGLDRIKTLKILILPQQTNCTFSRDIKLIYEKTSITLEDYYRNGSWYPVRIHYEFC